MKVLVVISTTIKMCINTQGFKLINKLHLNINIYVPVRYVARQPALTVNRLNCVAEQLLNLLLIISAFIVNKLNFFKCMILWYCFYCHYEKAKKRQQ